MKKMPPGPGKGAMAKPRITSNTPKMNSKVSPKGESMNFENLLRLLIASMWSTACPLASACLRA